MGGKPMTEAERAELDSACAEMEAHNRLTEAIMRAIKDHGVTDSDDVLAALLDVASNHVIAGERDSRKQLELLETLRIFYESQIWPLDDAKGSVRKQLAPYLIELGLVVVSWNELHDELGQLYYLVRGGPSLGHALEIWHSEKNDRNQRQRIRSELPGALSDLPRAKQKGEEWVHRAREEIEWILERADSLADERNNAVHSPLISELEANKWKLTSFTFFGHPRAKKLAGKELLSQFRWYSRAFRVLTAYTQHVRLALYIKPYSGWPERPSLPPHP
jgi:hypothetical protein